MKADQYFKLEVNFMSDDRILEMMVEMDAAESLGIYIALLVHLRQHDEYEAGCTPRLLTAFARKYGFRVEKVEEVLRNYNLFDIDEERQMFRSGYLDQALKQLEELRKRCSENGRKGAKEKRLRKHQQMPSDKGIQAKAKQNSIEEYSKEEKSIKNTSFMENEGKEETEYLEKEKPEEKKVRTINPDGVRRQSTEQAGRSWEELVDEVTASEVYMKEVSTHSGLGSLFLTHQQEAVRLFKEHVRLQGSGGKMLTIYDTQRYFTNFMRAKTNTCLRVREALLAESQRIREADPYRFETLVDGVRTYYGRPIPSDAPPRPGDAFVWNEQRRCWSR